MIVLAIDQGTSATKAVVVDDEGVTLSSATVPVRPDYRAGGAVEQDPGELWDSVVGAGRAAVDQAGVTIDAVALANQGETVLAWDPESGKALSRAIVWQDRRSEAVCARLGEHTADLASRTGLVLSPYFSVP